MSISLLLVTHLDVGKALYNAVKQTFSNTLPLQTTIISVKESTPIEQLEHLLAHQIEKTSALDGTLILTDLFGATPSNLANRFCCKTIQVIAGVNLSMLIRIMNYPNLSLDELCKKAVSGGQDGVIHQNKLCQPLT